MVFTPNFILQELKHKWVTTSFFLYTMSVMKGQKTRAKLVQAAIEFLNSNKKRLNVKELIKRADVGYGTFYNHFSSVEEIQTEALNKTIRDSLIDFKLDVRNENDYVYILYLSLLRAINLFANSPSIDWLLDNPRMFISAFKEVSQPNMENNFLNAVKVKQIKNASIESLLDFQDARHYVQWAGLGAMAQVASGELTDKEAFEKLAKSVRVVDIPQQQRDAIIKKIIKKKHPWEIKDNVDK
tara:strand:+ start:753 stop:1475 length:723 start_codon:yes stop_codon:yes gene_type:complete